MQDLINLYIQHPQSTLFTLTWMLFVVLLAISFIILFIRDAIVSSIQSRRAWKVYRQKQKELFAVLDGNSPLDRVSDENRQ